jgi:hypothetical protein
MKTNVGSVDKIVRFLIAVLMSVLYFTGTVSGVLGYVALAVGAIMLLTAVVGTCPLYMLFGINTCKVKK